MFVPCGQCIGCRLDRSKSWAIRCVHEASLHADNCFITLTYSPEFCPSDGSLVKSHFVDFMKRLRRMFSSVRIRYYMCGEYGEQLSRPHYHACLFGFDFPDKVLCSERSGYQLFSSAILEERWGFGFCSIGSLTFETAAYTARYILKKHLGDDKEGHYMRVDPITGECFFVEPEYTTMSRRPGIARDWFSEFGSEVFPSDEVIMRGRPIKPPRFYSDILSVESPDVFAAVKRKRERFAVKHVEDFTPRRLRDREIVTRARLSAFSRSYENES